MADSNPFASLFGSLASTNPMQQQNVIPQAPINYDRMKAILNSGILKNPNASMASPAPQSTTPSPTSANTSDPMSFLQAFFNLISGPGSDQARLKQIESDQALYRRMNNIDGGS